MYPVSDGQTATPRRRSQSPGGASALWLSGGGPGSEARAALQPQLGDILLGWDSNRGDGMEHEAWGTWDGVVVVSRAGWEGFVLEQHWLSSDSRRQGGSMPDLERRAQAKESSIQLSQLSSDM